MVIALGTVLVVSLVYALIQIFLINVELKKLSIEVAAMGRSTHQVQFVRQDPQEFEKMTEELKKHLEVNPFEDTL